MFQPGTGPQFRNPRKLSTRFKSRLGMAETRLKMRTPVTLEKSMTGIRET
jgi:hypothetical protein